MKLFQDIFGCCFYKQHNQPSVSREGKPVSADESPFQSPAPSKAHCKAAFGTTDRVDSLTAVQRLLSAVAGGSEDAWLYRLDSALAQLQEQLEADLACLHAVYEGGYTFATLSVSGTGAEEQQRGLPQSIQQDLSNSVAVLLTTQLRSSTAHSGSSTNAIRASAPPVSPAITALSGTLDRLPSDWQRLASKHGLQHFIAVPCCSGGIVVGVLTLASRQGASPPACWHAGVLGAVGAALALLLQPRQVAIATSILTDIHLARNVDELVRAVRRGVQDLVVSTTYLPPTLRIALIRSDGSAAAVFEEQGPRKSSCRFSLTAGGDAGPPFAGNGGVPEVLQPQANNSRRSIDVGRQSGVQHFGPQGLSARERTMSALTASNGVSPDAAIIHVSAVPRLLQAPGSLLAPGASRLSDNGIASEPVVQGTGVSDHAFSRLSMPAGMIDGTYSRASLPERLFAAAGLGLAGSFSMQGAYAAAAGSTATAGAAKGGARGHTLSLGNTLLGEALQKDAGLWISDCTLYLQETKSIPRDIVVSRGSRAVHSIAVCGGRSGGSPLLGAYCVYGSVVPRQLLRAVTLELEQLLKLLAPSVSARLSCPALADEWRYLHDELLDPAKVDTLKRPRRTSSTAPATDGGANGPGQAGNGASAASPCGTRPASPTPPLAHQHYQQGACPGSPAVQQHSRGGPEGDARAAGGGPTSGGPRNGSNERLSPPVSGGAQSAGEGERLPPGMYLGRQESTRKGDDAQGTGTAAAAAAAQGTRARNASLLLVAAQTSRPSSQQHTAVGSSILNCFTPSLVDGIGPGLGTLAALAELPPHTNLAPNAKPVAPDSIAGCAAGAPLLLAFGAAADMSPVPAPSGSMGSGLGGIAGAITPYGSPSVGQAHADLLTARMRDGSTGATVGSGPDGVSRVVTRALLTAPSFTVEAVRSNLGGGLRRAPLISGLHERLAAAQASRLVHGSAVEHQEELGAIDVHEKIGEGGYGEVYRGQYDGTEVAIKIVYEPNSNHSTILPRVGMTMLTMGDEASPSSARTRLCDAFELTVSVSVSHPHIVQVLTFFTDVYVHVDRGNGSAEPSMVGTRLQRQAGAGDQAGTPGAALLAPPPPPPPPLHPMAATQFSPYLRRSTGGGTGSTSAPPRVTLLPYPHPMASCNLSTVDVATAQFADYTALQAAMASNGSAAAQVVNASPPAMVICMEYMDAGSLSDAIVRGAFRMPSLGLYGTSQPNMKAIYTTLLEVALALRHLHALRLVHCDLKPSNVLLRSSHRDPRGFTVKLSDFGLVRLMEPCGEGGRLAIPRGVQHGTLTHMAPEVLSNDKSLPHDASLDIYAFGIIMWQIVYGGRLYPGVDAADLPKRVVEEGMRPRFISNVPSEYSRLGESCWAANPDARPTAAELVSSLKQLMGLGQRHAQRRHSALPPQRRFDRPMGLGLLPETPPALARLTSNGGSDAAHGSSGLGLGLPAKSGAESSYERVISLGAGLLVKEAQGEGGRDGRGSSSRSRSGGMRTRSLSYGAFPLHIL